MAYIPALGIDLGTTFSAVAVVSNSGIPEILPNSSGERLTPSAVFFDGDSVVVGQVARDAYSDNPDNTVLFIKRQIGTSHWFYDHKGHRYSPVDISALILKKLRDDAAVSLNQEVNQAVITVPAYFDDDRRRLTRLAGEIAGLQVIRLINEPTAAAIAFGAEKAAEGETVLVYDLGGGTFDVTIMRIENQTFTVIATDGDHQLGGKDFDDAIIRFATQQFSAQYGYDPTTDPLAASDLRTRAEKAKRELTERSKTMILIRSVEKNFRVELSCTDFSNLIAGRIDTTISLLRTTLKNANLTPQQIDRILLVGGSTRIPGVRERLKAFFGRDVDTSVNPDEAVAIGASIVAAREKLDEEPTNTPQAVVDKFGGLQVRDVTSHSLGIEASVPGTSRKINSILIARNTPLPGEVSREFITDTPGQTGFLVKVYQGEFQDPTLCTSIGEFSLTGLPPGRPAGHKVRVTLSCGVDGVINVTAVDIASGVQAKREVQYEVGQVDSQQASAKALWMKSQKIE